MIVLPTFIKHMHLTNIRNADIRTLIIEVSKLKQAIEMAETVQQVLVESTSKKARKSYSREDSILFLRDLSHLGTSNNT